jgi:hypothetical protein
MNLAAQVDSIFRDCLYNQDELPADKSTPPDAVIVQGIVNRFGFHPDRLAVHKKEIKAILDQMPPAFHKSGGGGMTFLNLCLDKDGNQWTDFHPTMEQLVTLGIGVKMAAYCLPREMWSAFPGEMPYITFDTSEA